MASKALRFALGRQEEERKKREEIERKIREEAEKKRADEIASKKQVRSVRAKKKRKENTKTFFFWFVWFGDWFSFVVGFGWLCLAEFGRFGHEFGRWSPHQTERTTV